MLHEDATPNHRASARISWAVASLICALIVVSFVSPRFAAVVLCAGLVGLIVVGWFNRVQGWQNTFPGLFKVRWVFAFTAFALISTIWSAAPADSILKSIFLCLVVFTVAIGAQTIYRASDKQIGFFCESIIIASAIGFLLIGIEIATDQWITGTFYTLFPELAAGKKKHIRVINGVAIPVTVTELNRRITLACFLFWPALALVYFDRNTIRKIIALMCIGFGSVMVLIYGSHQSSQLALVVSGITFLAAMYYLAATRRTLILAWAAAVFMALPLAWSLFSLGAHQQEKLPNSARARVVIWNSMSQLYKENYLFGIGSNATKTVVKSRANELNDKYATPKYHVVYRHPHNVYLEVWLELGLIGAVLFFITGYFLLKLVLYGSLPLQAIAASQFALFAAMIWPSYSMWQPWFMATIAIGILCTALAQRAALQDWATD